MLLAPALPGFMFFLATGFRAGFGWAARAGILAGLAALIRRGAAALRAAGFAWDLLGAGVAWARAAGACACGVGAAAGCAAR
ncbi:hypothetical protein [Sphingosinicella sp. CPCC 101087]|uniref:hypothetical protein n=1 Tax=Sphingosinicella sp. CPCC 101087 TaxID=2497754 RepID=UPI0013EC58E0|nr:hypothetical protein [Sphingosinicella sp. CPCC 101087]